MKVLLLDTGTQGLVMAQSLHKLGYEVGLLYREKDNYADLSNTIDAKYFIDCKNLNVEYLQFLCACIIENHYDAIIPMGDAAAEFVSIHIEELKKITHVKMPHYEAFLNGYDKNRLMSLCAKNGYPHPKTIDMSEYGEHIENVEEFRTFPYPAILKPNLTTGGRGMRIIQTYEELLSIYPINRKKYGECHLQKFIKEGGRQVKIQLYVDENHNLIASSVLNKVRWYPIKGGSSCCSVSIKDEKMVEICYSILKDINWVGFADFDTIGNPDTGELMIMEINPRVPACLKGAVVAGVNWAEVIINGYLNKPQKEYSYKEGVALRHLGFDVLWFIKSPKRFSAKPSWFKFWGKKVSYQDFDFCDQKPFWFGTFNNVKKLFNPEFKKDKQGA